MGYIHVPKMAKIDDAKVLKWLKKSGDPVYVGDMILEMETDKCNVEVQAEETGFLHIYVEAGMNVRVGQKIACIVTDSEQPLPTPKIQDYAQIKAFHPSFKPDLVIDREGFWRTQNAILVDKIGPKLCFLPVLAILMPLLAVGNYAMHRYFLALFYTISTAVLGVEILRKPKMTASKLVSIIEGRGLIAGHDIGSFAEITFAVQADDGRFNVMARSETGPAHNIFVWQAKREQDAERVIAMIASMVEASYDDAWPPAPKANVI